MPRAAWVRVRSPLAVMAGVESSCAYVGASAARSGVRRIDQEPRASVWMVGYAQVGVGCVRRLPHRMQRV